jgi:Rrf2 family protein
MLQLTKRTEYALIALSHLAASGGRVVSVREICDAHPLPRRVVAEALKALCRSRLVASRRGASGGYRLARPADAIRLREVLEALEGLAPDLAARSTHGAVGRIRADIRSLLERTTLDELAADPAPLAGEGAA